MMNSTTIDVTELKMNWAIDDVCKAIEELTELLEATRDLQTLEALSALLKALNTYITTVGESIATIRSLSSYEHQ